MNSSKPAQKLRNPMERNLAGLNLRAAMMDGISFDGETFLVAQGIGHHGLVQGIFRKILEKKPGPR